MQTNREDLGDRYRLIKIPYAEDRELAARVSQGYRDYFQGLDELQKRFERMESDF